MVNETLMQEVTKRLVETYKPLEIYLFGSYAWGHPDEESDVDLLVIVDQSDEKSYKRPIPGIYALHDLGISKDLLVLTKEEFDERAGNKTTLMHKIKQQGKILYARA